MVEEKDQATLTLHLLGEPQLRYGASSLAESLARKEQALLYYMACQPDQRFSREHLSTLLWGEVPESRSRYNLRRALWNVRRTLTEAGLVPEECLIVEGSWIQIPSAAPFQVDVRDFEQVLQLPESKSRFSVSSEMIRRIRRVLDFYRGEFLSGFSVPNAPEFEEWLVLEREHLFLLLLQALASLIQGFIARGERDEAIATCQRPRSPSGRHTSSAYASILGDGPTGTGAAPISHLSGSPRARTGHRALGGNPGSVPTDSSTRGPASPQVFITCSNL